MGKMGRRVQAVKVEEVAATITAIKGFNADLQCSPNGKPFQFEVGKTYKVSGPIKACSNGFHAVDPANPFHVWDFYSVVGGDGRLTRYAEVQLGGDTDREDDEQKRDTKIAAAEITVKAEISLPDFIRRAVNALVDLTRGKGDDPSGHYARIGSSGHYARIGSSGDYAQIGSSGDSVQIGSSGDYARIGSSGHYAQIGSSGHYAQIGSSGDSAQIGSSGHYAQIGSSGDYARIVAEGKNAVIACAGTATVTAAAGGAICIPYHDGQRKRFAVGYVGEDGVEAGVAYCVRNGKLAKAEG